VAKAGHIIGGNEIHENEEALALCRKRGVRGDKDAEGASCSG